jgi:hypothetical protein
LVIDVLYLLAVNQASIKDHYAIFFDQIQAHMEGLHSSCCDAAGSAEQFSEKQLKQSFSDFKRKVLKKNEF